MNKSTRQTIIVGILTLGSIIGGVIFMHSLRKGVGGSNAYKVFALLDDADGLKSKSRVMIAGIVVGEIIDITLDNEKARVDLWIREDVKLYKNATLAKSSVGFLGDQAIVLTRGDKKTGFIGKGGQIKIIRKIGLMAGVEKTLPKIQAAVPHVIRLTKALSDISDGPSDKGKGSLRDIAESLRAVAKAFAVGVKDNQQRVSEIIRSVQQITRVVAIMSRRNIGQVGDIIKDVKAVTGNLKRLSTDEKVIREILSNVRDLTGAFKQAAGKVGPGANRLEKAIAHLEKTLSQVRQISTKINTGKGSLGRLINDDRLINKIENAVVNVTGLVNKISLMKVNVRWRADYYLLHGRFRNSVAVTLRPTPDKYYTLELVDDARGVTSVTRTVRTTTDPRLPPVVNQEELTTRDSFRLSLQLNYKVWWFALRGGLIESSAGFGVDFLPWKDHVKISAEMFAIGLENLPRLRIFGTFNYWFLTLSAGADDILNQGQRDFFVGIGLRFTDDDLKAILPILPIPR